MRNLQTAEETRPEQSQLVEETYAEADTGFRTAQNIAPDHVQETTEGGSEIEEDAGFLIRFSRMTFHRWNIREVSPLMILSIRM